METLQKTLINPACDQSKPISARSFDGFLRCIDWLVFFGDEMLNTVRAILESKGFDFSNMEEGSITRADHIEGKNYACTGISYSNSDPILDKIIPFDTGENFAISSGEWIVRVDGGNLDAYNSLSE